MIRKLRADFFSMDALAGWSFAGYTLGEVWNGWACPYFSYKQAQKVMFACQEHDQEAWYDKASNSFVFGNGEGEEPDTFPCIEIDGKPLYALGAFAWIWEEMPSQTLS